MGFLKSYATLTKQSREIAKNQDVGAQMASGMDRMAQAQQMMAAQTIAANLQVNGLAGIATLTGVRQTVEQLDFQPILELDLSIEVPGRPASLVTVKQVVPTVYLAKALPGQQVAVKVDATDASQVLIAWHEVPVAV
jgi:hypothetical protein